MMPPETKDLTPAQSLEFIKNRTQNNINWEKLSETAEHIAQSNNLDSTEVAYSLIDQYTTGDQPLFTIAPKPEPIIKNTPPKDLSQYESGVTSTQGLKNLGLDILDTLGLTQFNERASQRERDTRLSLNENARKKTPYEELSEQEYWTLGGLKGSAASRLEYENLIKDQEIAQKDLDELSQEDKEHINKRISFLSGIFSEYSGKEDYEEFIDKVSSTEVGADLQAKLQFLNNIHEHKSIKDILTGSNSERKFEYLSAVESIAKTAGFKGIAYDKKGDVYFYDDAQVYKPNQHFFGNFVNILSANAGTIGASMLGATAALKKAKNPQQAIAAVVGGSALGATIGASSDVLLTNAWLGRENNAREIIQHAMQEGALSIVGDLAVLGGAQAVKQGIKAFQSTPLRAVAGKIVEYTPILGFVQRFSDGNAKAAMRLVNTSLSPQQQASLKEFSEHFGGGIDFEKIGTSKAYENIKAKFGENHFITKGAKTLNDAFMLKDQLSTQQKILQAIRADESGNLVAFLAEAANASPTLQTRLKAILNTTTQKLKDKLEYLHLSDSEIKEIFTNFERGTKQEYAQAIEGILGKVYDDSYKAVLPKTSYNQFRKELETSGVLPEDSMRFLNFVENNIYNEKGVTFNQLNNALKNLNSYYKQTDDPNFRDFVKNAIEKFIRDDIKSGVDSIFAQNATLYKDAQALFASALSDYGKMRATIKMVDKLHLRDEALSYERAFNNLYKYLLGQGGDITNLAKLTQHLDPKAAARVEINILGNLFNQHLRDYTDMQVFDSSAFLEKLKDLIPHFKSQPAKDFVEIAQGFDKLFKNDVLIADSIKKATTEKITSSIATSIEGAVRFQIVRMAFENLVRLLPHIPFLTGINERIQGAALRFHIKSALFKNLDVQDFKIDFAKNLQKENLNSQTKQIINKILGEVDSAQDSLIQGAQNLAKREGRQWGDNHLATSTTTTATSPNSNGIVTQEKIEAVGLQDLKFIDTKGKERTLNKETQEQWLKTFELENLEQSYIPKHSDEIKEALGGKEIRLQKGSLLKLVSQGREEFIPQIKAVLDEPEAILKDSDNSFLFVKHLKDEDYFVNVSVEKGEYAVSISNGIKESNNLANKLENGAKVLYQSPNASSNLQTLLQASRYSTNKIDKADSTTNTQNLQSIPQELQEQWIKEFNLKNIDDEFIPNFKPEVKEALERAGVTEDIKLTKGSLVKLIRENRFKYLDRIKPTLQEPDRIVKQDDITFIFARDFGEEKYFTSVAKDDNGEWVITSNAPKSENGLNNKIEKGGEEIYNKQAGGQINAHAPYDDVANSNTKLDKVDSTTNTIDLASPQVFKMQDFAIDSVQDFNKWAEFVGIKVPAKKRQETYKYIKNSIKAGFLEC